MQNFHEQMHERLKSVCRALKNVECLFDVIKIVLSQLIFGWYNVLVLSVTCNYYEAAVAVTTSFG